MNYLKILFPPTIIVFVIIYNILTPATFDANLFDVGIIVLVLVIMYFFSASQNSGLRNCWLKPSNIFIISFLAVNFQYIIDYRLGIKSNLSSYILYPNLLNYCYVLALAGLVSFVYGYTYRRYEIVEESRDVSLFDCYDNVPRFFVILQVLLFILFLATIDVRSLLLGTAFGDETKVSSFEGLFYTSTLLIVVFVSKKTRDLTPLQYLRSFPLISLIMMCIYMVLRVVSGDRGPFIYMSMMILYGYIYSTRKKWSLKLVILLFLVSSIFISLVGIARAGDLNFSFGDRLTESFDSFMSGGRFEEGDEKSIFSPTEELGFSFFVNQTVVNAVEIQKENFHYGMYQVYSVLLAIPYAPSFLLQNLHVLEKNLSSVGLADYYFFDSGFRTWSIGTTLISDFYLEFGIYGVVVGLFFTGMFLRYIDEVIFVRNRDSISFFLLLVVLHFSSQAVYIPRSVLLLNLQKILIGGILLYFYFRFNKKNKE